GTAALLTGLSAPIHATSTIVRAPLFYLMQCPCCGAQTMLHELERHTAPSMLIDPETGLPPDVAPDGHAVTPSPEAVARSQRRPLCQSCLDDVAAGGAVAFSVRLKGESTALAIASEEPLLHDEGGQVMVVRCPAAGCGALVDLVDGRLDHHFLPGLGQECHTSGVPVMVGEG
ncbi:hypothetical protein AB0A05_39170, partial [Streptomyces sp. NPDC046374]|uniref:hypothetical protein n=1 Tax=Streptomyces sp. NPDC046374 TaxID=3154917 RepID=UPI0033C3D1F0